MFFFHSSKSTHIVRNGHFLTNLIYKTPYLYIQYKYNIFRLFFYFLCVKNSVIFQFIRIFVLVHDQYKIISFIHNFWVDSLTKKNKNNFFFWRSIRMKSGVFVMRLTNMFFFHTTSIQCNIIILFWKIHFYLLFLFNISIYLFSKNLFIFFCLKNR